MIQVRRSRFGVNVEEQLGVNRSGAGGGISMKQLRGTPRGTPASKRLRSRCGRPVLTDSLLQKFFFSKMILSASHR